MTAANNVLTEHARFLQFGKLGRITLFLAVDLGLENLAFWKILSE